MESLQHVGGIDLSGCNVLPIVSCQDQYHYRNNMQFTFSTGQISGRTAQQPSHASSSSTSPTETAEASVHIQQAGTPATPEAQSLGSNNTGSTLLQTDNMGQAVAKQSSKASQHTESLYLGLHAMSDPFQIVPINICLLQNTDANKLLQAAAHACAHDPHLSACPHGFLKQLVIRCNSVGEYLIVIVTTSHQPHLLQGLVEAFCCSGIAVRGIVNKVVSLSLTPISSSPRISKSKSRLSKGRSGHSKGESRHNSSSDSVEGTFPSQTQGRQSSSSTLATGLVHSASHTLFGVSAISEKLCGLDFSISADSFFQVNSRQAEVLYGMVQKAAGTVVACSDSVQSNSEALLKA